MRLSVGSRVRSLVAVLLSLVATLLLAMPALAQAPEVTPAPGNTALQFFAILIVLMVGIIVLAALMVAFLMWANGQPVPGLSPMLQDLTARKVDAEGRPTGPSNLARILIGLSALAAVVLVVAFAVPVLTSPGQPAAPAPPPAAAQPTAAPAPAAPVVQAPAGVVQTSQANGCGGCHVIPEVEGAAGTVGPSLAGLGARAEEIIASPEYTGEAETAEEYIHEAIVDPNAYVVPGYPANVMPQNFEEIIPPDQLDVLVTYLSSLE